MRVADHDGFEPALRLDPGGCGVVEEREAVPEDVAVGGFDEDCALADGEFGGRDDGVEVWVRVDLGPGVGVLVCELGARGPGLAAGRDVLAWILW